MEKHKQFKKEVKKYTNERLEAEFGAATKAFLRNALSVSDDDAGNADRAEYMAEVVQILQDELEERQL